MTIAAPRRPATRNPRTKLGDALAQNLTKDFTEHGAGAIAKMRQDKPLDYMKLTSTRSCWRSKSRRRRPATWRRRSRRSGTRPIEAAPRPFLIRRKVLGMWIWQQSDGRLSREGKSVAHGYSGHDIGRNNPKLQSVRNVGPVPAGRWTIEKRYDSRNTGPCTLTLVPDADTITFGRSQFRIHGDSVARPGDASHGCIILPRAACDAIWSSGDRRLTVIA